MHLMSLNLCVDASMQAYIGNYDKQRDKAGSFEMRRVVRTVAHPQFEYIDRWSTWQDQWNNDVALLLLDAPSTRRPVALPPQMGAWVWFVEAGRPGAPRVSRALAASAEELLQLAPPGRRCAEHERLPSLPASSLLPPPPVAGKPKLPLAPRTGVNVMGWGRIAYDPPTSPNILQQVRRQPGGGGEGGGRGGGVG